MILNAIIGLAYSVAMYIIGLLPDATATDYANINNMTNALSSVRGYFIGANIFFPVDDLFTILRLIITIELIVFGFKVARFIAHILSLGVVP